jgi:hypothetical protein
MNANRRFGLMIATTALGVVGLLGLTACGRGANADPLASPEQSALAAIGINPADMALASDPSPGPSSGPGARLGNGNGRRVRFIRIALRRNILHGEATVQTKDGVKTIEVQRGTVTAIDDKTMTVKSTDGFTVTWTFGSPIHVIEHRTTVQPSAIKVGTEVGVAGTTDGNTATATLIVEPSAS